MWSARLVWVVWLFAALALSVSLPAAAQPQGFQLNRYEPTPAGPGSAPSCFARRRPMPPCSARTVRGEHVPVCVTATSGARWGVRLSRCTIS